MPFTQILLNSSNVVANSSNTKYSFNFQSPVQFKNAKIALSNIQIYYSWYNVSDFYNNKRFMYTWIDGTTWEVKLLDGAYDIESINAFFQSVMVKNGHYLYDSVNARNVYYMRLRSNITFYTFEFNADLVPTSLPTGYTKPGSWALPTTAKTPQISILSNNNFQNLIGITPNVYPNTAGSLAPFVLYSQNTPKIAPVTALVLRCNLIKNKYSNPVNDVLYSVAIGSTPYAESIEEKANTYNWCNIADGQYNDITIQIFDQDLKPMQIRDSQLLISLVIEEE